MQENKQHFRNGTTGFTGKKNRNELVKAMNTAKRLAGSSIYTLDYVEYQFSDSALETSECLG